MGYNIRMLEGCFKMKKENFEDALKALKSIFVPENMTCFDETEEGIRPHFAWSFNKDDYFKLTIMSTYAEEESRKVSERVFSGQATARANGVHFGNGNILGYDLVKGKNSKETTYIINEEQAETVRVIYNLALQGYGMKKIKNYLEDNGYKTAYGKSRWYVSSIEKILRYKTYIGVYEYMQNVTINPLTHLIYQAEVTACLPSGLL